MTMLLAERFTSTSAPARAAALDGGIGTQTSSQISIWKVKGALPVERKIWSVPNGASWPARVIVRPQTPAPEVKWRRS